MFHANLFCVYEVQELVKADIIEIIRRVQSNNTVVNDQIVRATVLTS